MTEVWIVRHVEASRRGNDYATLIGACSSFAKVEALIARRFPTLARYVPDPGEFSARGGRFREVVDGQVCAYEWVRVDLTTIDDPAAEG